MKHIIKTNGTIQNFSSIKFQNSITRSLQAVHVIDDEVENIATHVTKVVTAWLENKHEVSTNDVRAVAARELAKYSKDAAVLYKKHKDLW